jgi:hypothetical protein
MNSDFLHQLTSRDSLLAIGISLVVVGIFLRGFAQGSRRAIALRRQHWLHVRKLGEADPTDRQTGWFERHLPVIANTTVAAGVVITLLAFFRK